MGYGNRDLRKFLPRTCEEGRAEAIREFRQIIAQVTQEVRRDNYGTSSDYAADKLRRVLTAVERLEP